MTSPAPSAIPDWLAEIWRADVFAAYLRQLGHAASPVPVAERTAADAKREREEPELEWSVSTPPLSRRRMLTLEGSPIVLVSMHAHPAPEGPRLLLAHHYVVPVATGHVPADAPSHEAIDCILHTSSSHLRRRRSMAFEGGALAQRLQSDRGLIETLVAELGRKDDLIVHLDDRRTLARVVHTHPLSERRPLWRPSAASFYGSFLSNPLFHAITRIAKHLLEVAECGEPPAEVIFTAQSA